MSKSKPKIPKTKPSEDIAQTTSALDLLNITEQKEKPRFDNALPKTQNLVKENTAAKFKKDMTREKKIGSASGLFLY